MKKTDPDAPLRRKNLQKLIDERFAGRPAALINAYDLNQGEISGLLNGKKSFGPVKAETLEERIGLPKKWLSTEHGEARHSISEPTAAYSADLLDLYGEILLNVDKAIAAIEAGFGYKAKPGLRTKVLRILIERGDAAAWTDSAALIGQIASLAKTEEA